MSTKYTVLWMGVALGVLVLVMGWRDGWRKMILYGVVYGIAAAAMMVPWLVRNVVWYGNPVYPLVFEAGDMDSIRQEWYAQPDSGLDLRIGRVADSDLADHGDLFGCGGRGDVCHRHRAAVS